uniref:non-specific serine/threonine protein kinase n=1 Tax=Knipowitschia caucasica TaxID=637954 RepID=A0AAV2K1E6_KNICA
MLMPALVSSGQRQKSGYPRPETPEAGVVACDPKFSSPELFRDEPYTAGPTTVWQLGLLLYFMLHNQRPLIRERFPVPIPRTLPENLKDLLKRCLTKDPKERISLEDIRSHPWLQEV